MKIRLKGIRFLTRIQSIVMKIKRAHQRKNQVHSLYLKTNQWNRLLRSIRGPIQKKDTHLPLLVETSLTEMVSAVRDSVKILMPLHHLTRKGPKIARKRSQKKRRRKRKGIHQAHLKVLIKRVKTPKMLGQLMTKMLIMEKLNFSQIAQLSGSADHRNCMIPIILSAL